MAQPTLHSLAEHFADLPDPRLDRNKEYTLLDIIDVTVCAIVCGCDTWVDVERFGLSSFIKLFVAQRIVEADPRPSSSLR